MKAKVATGTLDFSLRLAAALRSKRDELGLSLRQVAAQTGISASTLSRIENSKGHLLEVATFLGLCDWLEVDPASFIVSDSGDTTILISPLQDIETRLRGCPEAPELCRVIAEIIRLIRIQKENWK